MYQKYLSKLSEIFGEREAAALLRALEEDLELGGIPFLQLEKQARESLLDSSVEKIIEGVPLQYLTGKSCFYGRFFQVNEDVLIPRPETEELVYYALKKIPKDIMLNILDVGTGSGCIAITVALERPDVMVYALDVSSGALKVAKNNAERLGAENVHFIRADFLSDDFLDLDLPGFDFLLSNPPYISKKEAGLMTKSTLEKEPGIALFAPEGDVLAFYRRIAELLPILLKTDGYAFLEINEFRAEETSKLFAVLERKVEIISDMQSKDRILIAGPGKV